MVLAFVPFQIIAAALQMKIFTGQGAESGHKDTSEEEVGKVNKLLFLNVLNLSHHGEKQPNFLAFSIHHLPNLGGLCKILFEVENGLHHQDLPFLTPF